MSTQPNGTSREAVVVAAARALIEAWDDEFEQSGSMIGSKLKALYEAAKDPSLSAEVERLRAVESHAREVMRLLEIHGTSIVGHLLDTDDNSGQWLREALGMVAT